MTIAFPCFCATSIACWAAAAAAGSSVVVALASMVSVKRKKGNRQNTKEGGVARKVGEWGTEDDGGGRVKKA